MAWSPDAPRVPNLQRLLDVGFERVGTWMASIFKSGGIDFSLTKNYPSNVVYAFAVRNFVNYVGVTNRGLAIIWQGKYGRSVSRQC